MSNAAAIIHFSGRRNDGQASTQDRYRNIQMNQKPSVSCAGGFPKAKCSIDQLKRTLTTANQ